MNAFEEIVAGLFRHEGYWTRASYKINLSKGDKVKLENPTMPRPEIDILAYKVTENTLLWVECKSYLDSRGVTIDPFVGKDDKNAKRYKVFTQPKFRKLVSARLINQVTRYGLTRTNPRIKYCLVAGHIAKGNHRAELQKHFKQNGWLLYDESWLKAGLKELSASGYEDDISIIVAKLFSEIGSRLNS